MVWLPSNIWFLSKISVRCCCFLFLCFIEAIYSRQRLFNHQWLLEAHPTSWTLGPMRNVRNHMRCVFEVPLTTMVTAYTRVTACRMIQAENYEIGGFRNLLLQKRSFCWGDSSPARNGAPSSQFAACIMGLISFLTPSWMHEISHELELKQLCILNFPDDRQWNLTVALENHPIFYKG